MNINTLTFTSIVAAAFMTLALKFLHFFKFIKWSPISWAKKLQLFASAHFSLKWVLLFIALTVFFAILYIIFSFIYRIPPSVTALISSIIVVLALEWVITNPKSTVSLIKSASIPLFAISAIVFRFIVGTAVFMKKLSVQSMK